VSLHILFGFRSADLHLGLIVKEMITLTSALIGCSEAILRNLRF
jgi:hypothetical protein